MVAERMGKALGSCKGKGGSMHIADVDKGMLGANGIGTLAVAVGQIAAVSAGYCPVTIPPPRCMLVAIGLVYMIMVILPTVTIWCDSKYTVQCGNGAWKRKKNTDLWAKYDEVLGEVRLRGNIAVRWTKGHVGTAYNEAADGLATRAALDFDGDRYRAYRAAQAASGHEMPGQDVPERRSEVATMRPADGGAHASEWIRDADYTMVLHTHLDGGGQPNVGKGPTVGRYQLWTKDGRGQRRALPHVGDRSLDEAEYLTLSRR